MHLKLESVTPEKALKYLEGNHEFQRHSQPRKVTLFSEMMKKGDFNGENGDTIKFAKNGRGDILIDGQHRLLAIIESGKTIKLAVMRGLKTESFITLDQGIGRTVENYYQIAHKPHAKVCATVAKWLYYTEFGKTPLTWQGKGAVPIPGLVSKWSLDVHPEIPDIISRVSDYLAQFQRKGLGTKNHLAYCYYNWHQEDQIDAYAFVKYLGSGEGEVPKTITSLREYLMAESSASREIALPGSKVAVKTINALNTAWLAVRSGKKNIIRFKRLVSVFDKKLDKKTQGINVVPALTGK
jgi:hypothetical protein